MKISLLYPNEYIPCDGIRLISALLRRDGHDVQLISIPRAAPADCTDAELRKIGEFTRDAELILVGVYSAHEHRARRLSAYLKSIRPERLVVWGGPHCIGAPQESLHVADVVCFSEGDEAVPRFVNLLARGDEAWREVPSIAFRESGSVHVNQPYPLLGDLDALPFYDYTFDNEWVVMGGDVVRVSLELLERHLPNHPFLLPTATFLTSRGCPHHCTYCNNIRYTSMYGRIRIRRTSVARFLDEVVWTLERLPSAEHVVFSDDDFLVRSEQELEEFAARYTKEVGLPYAICLSATTFNRRKLEILAESGLSLAQIGVQSGSERILTSVYDRKTPIRKTAEVIAQGAGLLASRGASMLCDFIIDNPYETPSDVLKTYRFLVRLPKGVYAEIYALSLFPGSPLLERAVKDGHIATLDYSTYRDYGSREIRYQVNYPLLLILVWETLYRHRVHRWFPGWLLLLPAWGPLAALMDLIPRPFWAWTHRTLPPLVSLGAAHLVRLRSRAVRVAPGK